jgi:hypothetical protein
MKNWWKLLHEAIADLLGLEKDEDYERFLVFNETQTYLKIEDYSEENEV